MNSQLVTRQTPPRSDSLRRPRSGLPPQQGRFPGHPRRSTQVPVRAAGGPAAPDTVRVLLVEDHPGVSYAVEQVFAQEADIELVASGASAYEAIARGGQIDVVIVDYEQAGQDGLALARTLTRLPDAPRVLIYTAYADAWMAVATVVAGADGLLSKASFGDELSQAVRVLANGGRHLPHVARQALEQVVAGLPPTEQSITNMLLSGVDAATVIRVLSITTAELDARRSSILKALSVPTLRGPLSSASIERATRERVEAG